MMNEQESSIFLQSAQAMLVISEKDGEPIRDIIEALGHAVDALNKQIPRKPKGMRLLKGCDDLFLGYCPSCEEGLNSEFKYCCNCGQKIDWKR